MSAARAVRACVTRLPSESGGAVGKFAVLCAGEYEQALQEAVDPVELGAQPVGQRDRLGWRRVRFGQGYVDRCPHGGQWCAQFVGGVRDEPALGGEGRFQALQ
ncbi:hypothetical protein GCM10020219_035190 [Nonomuraea dietziae]